MTNQILLSDWLIPGGTGTWLTLLSSVSVVLSLMSLAPVLMIQKIRDNRILWIVMMIEWPESKNYLNLIILFLKSNMKWHIFLCINELLFLLTYLPDAEDLENYLLLIVVIRVSQPQVFLSQLSPSQSSLWLSLSHQYCHQSSSNSHQTQPFTSSDHHHQPTTANNHILILQ